jgi:hypothetical protein
MSETNSVSPLRQRMLEDMAARKLNRTHSVRDASPLRSERAAKWLSHSPELTRCRQEGEFVLALRVQFQIGANIKSP